MARDNLDIKALRNEIKFSTALKTQDDVEKLAEWMLANTPDRYRGRIDHLMLGARVVAPQLFENELKTDETKKP